MAIEAITSPAFNVLPATAGTLGPIRIIDTTTRQARVITTGTTFQLQVLISNAINRTMPEHLFLPPDDSFEVAATVTEPSLPVTIPGPMKYIRCRVVSGTVDGCTITQTSFAERGDGLAESDVRALIAENLVLYDTETVQIAGLSVTGDVLRVAGDAATGTASVTINGQTITGGVIGAL